MRTLYRKVMSKSGPLTVERGAGVKFSEWHAPSRLRVPITTEAAAMLRSGDK